MADSTAYKNSLRKTEHTLYILFYLNNKLHLYLQNVHTFVHIKICWQKGKLEYMYWGIYIYIQAVELDENDLLGII